MKNSLLGLVVGLILLITACSKNKPEFGGIRVKLTDAPAAYKKVLIDIKEVQIHNVPKAGKSDWISLPTTSGIYDLLTLQNGIDSTIVNTTQLEEGKITEMRLLLGDNNFVVDSMGVTHNLTVPSGSQTGIKITGPIQIKPNTTVQVLIDFDAEKSVVVDGKNEYHLQPVIKVVD